MSIKVYKYISIKVLKYKSIKVLKYKSIKVLKYKSIKVYKYKSIKGLNQLRNFVLLQNAKIINAKKNNNFIRISLSCIIYKKKFRTNIILKLVDHLGLLNGPEKPQERANV